MGEKGTFVYRDQYHTGLGKQRRVNAMCELMEKFGEIKCKEKILPVKRAVPNEIFTA